MKQNFLTIFILLLMGFGLSAQVTVTAANNITGANNITATGTATLGGNAYPTTTGTNGQVLTTNGAGAFRSKASGINLNAINNIANI